MTATAWTAWKAVLGRDVRREVRSKDALLAGLLVAGLFLLVDLFAFTDLVGQERAAAAAIWTPILFGAAALCARCFAADTDRGTLDLLLLAPVPRLWHGASRTLTNLATVALLTTLTAGATCALFAVPASAALALVLALAVVGVAVVGTLAGGLAAHARSRDSLVPVLMLPVLAPLVQAGVHATWQAISGANLGSPQLQAPLLLMAGYDLVACGVAWLLWPHLLEG